MKPGVPAKPGGAEASLWVCSAQSSDQIRRWMPALRREMHTLDPLPHKLVNLVCAVSLEGRSAHHEFEQQDTQHPPVHSLVVSSAVDDLRSHVVRSSDQGVSRALCNLRQAHVSEFTVAAVVQQEILWLQISIDHTAVVQMDKRLHHATNVESSMSLAAVQAQALIRCEQLTTQRCLQKEINMLSSIVGREELHYEGRVHHLEDALLIQN
mmetsp:Transcript_764/g.1621  ORF Transcript_764/g.1621 Transcript_764/m.1621 type:complete len:210 (+) Transcript_764:485-1114(+)